MWMEIGHWSQATMLSAKLSLKVGHFVEVKTNFADEVKAN